MAKFTDLSLNEIFGFMTIVAAIEAGKGIFENGPYKTDVVDALFFVYFVLFRTKMYLDDSAHDFSAGHVLNALIAIASWFLFVFAAASMKSPLDATAAWMVLALLVSIVWCIYSDSFGPRPQHSKYVVYVIWNIVHIAILVLAAPQIVPGLVIEPVLGAVPALVILVVAVLIEWIHETRSRNAQAAQLRRAANRSWPA